MIDQQRTSADGAGARPLWVISEWAAFFLAALVAVARLLAGKGQSAPVMQSPREIGDLVLDCDPDGEPFQGEVADVA